MSQESGRPNQFEAPDTGSGLEELYQSHELRSPVEPLDDEGHRHDANEHLASIYDCQREQFAAVLPFVQQGLERGERCLYVADDNSREEILEAMRTYGIDVDAAMESGALSIHSKEETYLRTGEFESDAMVSFWKDTLERARNEGGYAGVRAAAEMTWSLSAESTFEQLADYEAILNSLFSEDDYTVLCQYNRERFPPEVIRDVISTHPHIIADETAYHNVYYEPPDEYFGENDAARDVERMMGTLRERTEMKRKLKQRQQYLRKQHDITADTDRTFGEKLQALFELGCERFDLELGAMACVEPETDGFVIEYTSGEHEHFEPGTELPLSETYCTAVTETKGIASVSEPLEAGYDDITVHREFGLETYLGTYIEVDGGFDRTFFFVSSEPRSEPFSAEEHTFHRLLGQWVQYELERQQRERHQRQLYEIAADTDRSFDEKLQAMFELGCERFDLELGGMARIDPETDRFEFEAFSDDHEELRPGVGGNLSDTFCRRLTDGANVADVIDPIEAGFEDTVAYQRFGVRAYLGTRVELSNDHDRTLFFVSSDERETEFTEAERTFQDLLGQWVQYELEQRNREETLQQKNDRLENFASMLAHELRNPVAIGQIYGQQLPDESDAEAVSYITEAFDRIEDMIDVMLVLSRGREAVDERVPVDVGEVAVAAWDEVDAPEATLDVETDYTIAADETYIRHLFRNLLENAVEHGTPDVAITVGESSSGFYVSDDGPGIPAEERETVFEAGYTTTSSGQGTGLGLAFVRELASVYEWDVSVKESDAGGARFEFENVDPS